jgi:murein L,D-transpeptidase YafK
MKLLTLIVLLLSAAPSSPEQPKSFRDQQWQYPRVRAASKEKDAILQQRFHEKGLAYPPHAILLRAFKKEAVLELWATDADQKPYVLVHEYRICTSSGTLGPKRRFGDEQVPEGFYELDWFNPQSNFFLSLHISYPNASDRVLGSRQNPGGDIFLHGNCASIGCIPITDDGIKEVYWLAVLVHSQGQQRLPIEIFPARLTDAGLKSLAGTYSRQSVIPNRREGSAVSAVPASSAGLISFWANLKQGYDLFEKTHRAPHIETDSNGMHVFF